MDEPTQDDAAKAEQHELLLTFPNFNEDVAWELGTRIRAAAQEAGTPVLIDITIGGHSMFRTAMSGTSPANADWARRKQNLVNLLHMSSYRVSLARARGLDVIGMMGLDLRDHAPAGGCFPIRVTDTGFIGTATVSGLPEREDHNLVVTTIAAYLGVDLGDSRL